MVIWSRGSKQAKTKKRVLNEQVQSATFDEKFQINTQMELGEDGKPVKSKIVSKLYTKLTSLSIVYTDSREWQSTRYLGKGRPWPFSVWRWWIQNSQAASDQLQVWRRQLHPSWLEGRCFKQELKQNTHRSWIWKRRGRIRGSEQFDAHLARRLREAEAREDLAEFRTVEADSAIAVTQQQAADRLWECQDWDRTLAEEVEGALWGAWRSKHEDRLSIEDTDCEDIRPAVQGDRIEH